MSTEDDYTLEIDTSIHVSDLEVGDILEFERQLGPFTYFHCGNYAGNNMIIHKGTAPLVDSVQVFHAKWKNDIGYRIDSLQEVARGSKVYRNNMLDDIISPSKEELMLRAKAMYGEGDYDRYLVQQLSTFLYKNEADSLTSGYFLTTVQQYRSKRMVQVVFDDYDSNIAGNNLTNTSISVKHKDKDSMLELAHQSKNMTDDQNTINYSSRFECELNNTAPILDNSIHGSINYTFSDTDICQLNAYQYESQMQNAASIFNNYINFTTVDTFGGTHTLAGRNETIFDYEKDELSFGSCFEWLKNNSMLVIIILILIIVILILILFLLVFLKNFISCKSYGKVKEC